MLHAYGIIKKLIIAITITVTLFFTNTHYLRSLFYTTIDPNGVNDNLAILKCCFPKGIPTIVQHKLTPIVISAIANGKPVIQIHKRFNKKLPVPPPGFTTYLPNGNKQSVPILKHCFPAGIPMIVIDQNIPAIYQDIPINPPPVRNQIMLPIKLMNNSHPFTRQFHLGKSIFHLLRHQDNHCHFPQENLRYNHNQISFLVPEDNRKPPKYG